MHVVREAGKPDIARVVNRKLPRSETSLAAHHVAVRNGAQGRDRTTDTAIFSRMLYQLSYLGIPGRPKGGASGRFIERSGAHVHPPSPAFACGFGVAGPLCASSPNIWGNTASRRLRGRSPCRG